MVTKQLLGISFAFVMLLGSTSLVFADSDVGTVESSLKITGNTILSSNNSQTVVFEEQDRMGITVTDIEDFDGDGVSDIVIGMGGAHTYHISEGDRAMNILLMNSDGTIKDQRAITYDEKGLPDGCYDSTAFDKDDIGFGEKITWLGSITEGQDPVLMVVSVDEGTNNYSGNVYALSLKYNSDETLSPVTACTRINARVGGFNPLPSDDYPYGDTYFGYPIENAGDLDDDGFTDVYVGVDNGYDGIGATEFYILYLQQNSTTSAVTVKDHKKLANIHTNVTNNSIIDDMMFLELDGNNSTQEIAFGASGVFGGSANKVYIGSFYDDFTLNWNQTISDDSGDMFAGNSGTYFADNDEFGESLVNLGDVDGDGVVDIAVGSENDHSDERELGQSTSEGHGAVYVLFMNNNGTVKEYQKISNLHGNLTDGTTSNEFWSNAGAFGAALSDIDLDNDGVNELIVTSMDDDSNGNMSGLGNDTLFGGRNNDFLYGNEGDDSLNGKKGIDTCDAGSGINTVINCKF